MIDFPTLPDFLRITQAERNVAWKGKVVRSLGRGNVAMPKRNQMTPEARALLKDMERREKEKRDARFAELRERAELKKHQAGR